MQSVSRGRVGWWRYGKMKMVSKTPQTQQDRLEAIVQSVGIDWKFDMAAVRVMCCTAVSLKPPFGRNAVERCTNEREA